MATKTKKRLSFTFFKKHKKIAIFLICIAIFASSFAFINYSRYVKDVVKVYYLRTKNFYFNSNLLVVGGDKMYTTQPWVIGNDRNYAITVEMNSRLNSLKATNDDILYRVACSVKNTDAASCTIKAADTDATPRNAGEFKIPGNSDTTSPNTNTFVVEIIPRNPENLKNGQEVIVEITAESTSPYELKLGAKFKLIVGDYAITYDIIDKPNQRYFDVVITNSVPDKGYMATLNLDVNEVVLDESNHIIDTIKNYNKNEGYDPPYNHSSGQKYDPNYITVDANGTIDSIKFLVQENSGTLVRFYKKDPSKDYSYDSGIFKGSNMSNTGANNIAVTASFDCYAHKYSCGQ